VTRGPAPALSVIIPTFNNREVLERCLESWREHASGQPVELVVIEDGCSDGTPEYLDGLSRTEWGARALRWFHEDDAHELRCTNRGFREARAPLLMTWQDDMFLRSRWLVPELVETFARYPEIGLLSLGRGLDCFPHDEPVRAWEDLVDWRRLRSTIGPAPLNWFRIQEVDAVVRPWVTRRACLEAVGELDEVFRPTEWDEADYSFRLRRAGWKTATCGYERLGAFYHLGSTTISRTPSAKHQARVLRNGLVFHERWDETIRREHARRRRTWWRRTPAAGWAATARRMLHFSVGALWKR